MAYTKKTWVDGNRVYATDINRWETGIDDVHKEKLDKTTYTANDILTKLKTVDGHNTGLDADTLDGAHASSFVQSSQFIDGLFYKLDKTSYTSTDILAKLKTVDGDSSGLDADLLDGKHATSFANATHTHTWDEISGTPEIDTVPPHTHTIANITNLQAELIGKASANHTHSWGTITSKPDSATRWPTWSEVTSKPSTFTPSTHSHSWTDISGKPTTATRWPSWSEVTSKPSTFKPESHTHNYSQITGDIPFITYGTSVPTSLPIRHIFIKI